MNQKPKLLVDYCSYEAAKFAVMNWHYSKRMPKSKLVKFGVWEDDNFIGSVMFGYGTTANMGKPYGLNQFEVCELVRIALTSHISHVSKILRIAIKKLKKTNIGIRLIVSYADEAQEHVGVVYQSSNWIYTGGIFDTAVLINGEIVHRRSLGHRYGSSSVKFLKSIDKNAKSIKLEKKHRYLYPLDRAMRKQIAPLAKPYPKHADG